MTKVILCTPNSAKKAQIVAFCNSPLSLKRVSLVCKLKKPTRWVSFLFLVIAPGFEPGTVCLEGRCSIQLSYATIWCANLAILIYYKNKTTISSHTKKPHISCRAFQFFYFDGSVMIAVISMMMVMVALFVHFFLHDFLLIIG